MKRIDYLKEKEKVCPLDKEERFELDIAEIQRGIEKQHISTVEELEKVCGGGWYNYLPEGWNACDKCGALSPSEELIWVEYLDEEYDKKLKEKADKYCALCDECVAELKG